MSRHTYRSLMAVLVAVTMAAPATLPGQRMELDGPRRPSRAFVGLHVMAAQPLGEFADYIDWGGASGGSSSMHSIVRGRSACASTWA